MPSFAILFHGQPEIQDLNERQAAFADYMAWAQQHSVVSHPFKSQSTIIGPMSQQWICQVTVYLKQMMRQPRKLSPHPAPMHAIAQ